MEGSIRLGPYEYKRYRKILNVRTLSEGRALEKDFKDSFSPEYDAKKNNIKTLEELIKSYDHDKRKLIKSSTKQSNRYISKLFEPLFDVHLPLITPKEIEKILDKYYEKNYSVGYLNRALEYLNKVFNYAIENDIMSRNPVKKVNRYKRPDEIKKEMNFYTMDEFKQFIACFPRNRENDDYACYVIVNCLYFLGLRVGECLALQPRDVDLKKGTVRINKTVSWYTKDHKFMITSPKTQNSIRTVLIPKQLKSILVEYFEWYYRFYNVRHDSFLFGIDRPILPKTIRKRIDKACELSGVKRIRIHDFRHSHASLLANTGMPIKAIAQRLGHTVNECQRTYIHLFESTERELVDAIDREFERCEEAASETNEA